MVFTAVRPQVKKLSSIYKLMPSHYTKRSSKERKTYPLKTEKVYRSKIRLEDLLKNLGPMNEITWGHAVGKEVW